jgi:branched-chain amino acid transport system ATP-binding protein
MAKSKTARKREIGDSGVPISELDRLAGAPPLVAIDHLHAGYGRMQVLSDISLRVARGRSLCLVGPNGAGKSTVLNAIYGFARILSGTVMVSGSNAAKLAPSEKLKSARLAYVLQKDSVFPDMTVEENLLMGGYLLELPAEAKHAAEARAVPSAQGAPPRARPRPVGRRAAAARDLARADHGSRSHPHR